MLKKIILCIMLEVALISKVWADSHTTEYLMCMKQNSEDQVLAKCQEKEYSHYLEAINEKIKEIEEDEYFRKIVSRVSLNEQYQSWMKSTQIYCSYYVKVKENRGYSEEFLRSECLLERAESYDEWLESIISNAEADIKG